MSTLFDVIEEWDLPAETEIKTKRNPKRGIEFRPDSEINYKPQSQEGKVKVVTNDATYYVRPKNLDRFLEKLRKRQEQVIQEEADRRERWLAIEEANEPVPVIVKEKPKAPDYSDIKITHYSSKDLKKIVGGMSERELLAYLQYYRKRKNRGPINALKMQLEELSKIQGAQA